MASNEQTAKALWSSLPRLGRNSVSVPASIFVSETRLGFWFLGTKIWTEHVINIALTDLEKLIPERKPSYPVVLDAGCGQGNSFRLLIERFRPERVIAVDFEDKCIRRAAMKAAQQAVSVDLQQRDLAALTLPDESVDLIFCHQTFHHLCHQQSAVRHFYRVLKPGGLLLFAESTRFYIESWIIRLLFRHPMYSQRSAEEYLDMIRNQGFIVSRESVSFPYLWWSRPDLGALEFFGSSIRAQSAATLVNVAAVKPE